MTTPSTRPVRFERVLKVLPDDIDELGHVNNAVYLRWVQEIAAAHWRAAAPPELHADGLLLARATSIWCPLDARTGRPRRIDPALHEYFQEPTHPPSA